jgi:hypothetical protein
VLGDQMEAASPSDTDGKRRRLATGGRIDVAIGGSSNQIVEVCADTMRHGSDHLGVECASLLRLQLSEDLR